MGTVSFSMVTVFRLHSGLQTNFRIFDTGFICASAIRYYISSPILNVDMQEIYIFVTAARSALHSGQM
jgi:hypothetical protein